MSLTDKHTNLLLFDCFPVCCHHVASHVLSSFFVVQIKTDDALQYVQGLVGSDSGYSLTAGVPSDLPATRQVLVAIV